MLTSSYANTLRELLSWCRGGSHAHNSDRACLHVASEARRSIDLLSAAICNPDEIDEMPPTERPLRDRQGRQILRNSGVPSPVCPVNPMLI
jgi:hypothetical protein